MILSSLAEVVSIGAVIPFIGALSSPEEIFYRPFMQPFIQAVDLTSPNQLILPLTIVFIVAALLAGALRLI